jgi:hypothetical protein
VGISEMRMNYIIIMSSLREVRMENSEKLSGDEEELWYLESKFVFENRKNIMMNVSIDGMKFVE